MQSTYCVRSPTVWYNWTIIINANYFTHIIKARIGWHDIVKRNLIFFGNSTGNCTTTNFPHNQAKRIHIGTSQRLKTWINAANVKRTKSK